MSDTPEIATEYPECRQHALEWGYKKTAPAGALTPVAPGPDPSSEREAEMQSTNVRPGGDA